MEHHNLIVTEAMEKMLEDEKRLPEIALASTVSAKYTAPANWARSFVCFALSKWLSSLETMTPCYGVTETPPPNGLVWGLY